MRILTTRAQPLHTSTLSGNTMKHIILLATVLNCATSNAATLTCDPPDKNGWFPRTTVYSATTTVRRANTSEIVYPVVQIFMLQTPAGTQYCDPTKCTVAITITDSAGTTYQPAVPYQAASGSAYRSPTSVPAFTSTTVTISVQYSITPADGSTMHGRLTRVYPWVYNASNQPVGFGDTVDTNSISDASAVYQAPNQHDYGQISALNPTGLPLTLPPPPSGSLRANVLWKGPAGTSMDGTIGASEIVPIPMGVATMMDTAGQGLQVDLRATKTATPGPITGNLTLTLTCP